ncbi:MAG TPA: AI-2E family transporter [Leptolyngbyaceae cyanobacterium]
MSKQRLTISLSNLLIIIGIGLLLALLWQIRSLLIILMVSIVMAATIAPIVNAAERLRLPRWLAVITVYLILIAIVTGGGILIGPAVIDQIQLLAFNTPIYLENLQALAENWVVKFYDGRPELITQLVDTQALTTWVFRSSQEIFLRSVDITKGIVGGVLSFILALLISGYMVADSTNLIKGLVQLFPSPWEERLAAQVIPMRDRMGGYIQGRVAVAAILGIAVSFGLSILGLSDFALGLGAIAGVTDLIPFFGPILGAIPALIVALSQGGWTFLWVLLLFIIVQNLETYLLDPILVGSSVKIHPLYQLLAVLGGTQVLGIIGALIVPPWVAGVSVLVDNLYLQPKLMAKQPPKTLSTQEDAINTESPLNTLSVNSSTLKS